MSSPEREKIHCASRCASSPAIGVQVVFLKKALAILCQFQEPRVSIGKFFVQFTVPNAGQFLLQFFRDEQGFRQITPP